MFYQWKNHITMRNVPGFTQIEATVHHDVNWTSWLDTKHAHAYPWRWASGHYVTPRHKTLECWGGWLFSSHWLLWTAALGSYCLCRTQPLSRHRQSSEFAWIIIEYRLEFLIRDSFMANNNNFVQISFYLYTLCKNTSPLALHTRGFLLAGRF